MHATFHHQEQLTDSIVSFWFELERPVQYTAGQFTELTLKHANPDDRGIRRWFTLSSSPSDDLMCITTRIASTKSSSFKKTLCGLQAGAEVDLDEPMGDFVLPKLMQTPLIFVAGGIGITPFHSMMEWMAETAEERDIHLFYAVRNEDDIIFLDTIQKSGVHATIVVDQPSDAWGGVRGQITVETILGIDKPSDDTLIYLSGPEPMLAALKTDLLGQGIGRHQIVTDYFPGYSTI